MNLQILQDNFGNQTGVFVPIADWDLIKNNYPDIENLENDLPQWEKNLIDQRLDNYKKNPQNIKPFDELLKLKRKKHHL
jgi:hypothetical protein